MRSQSLAERRAWLRSQPGDFLAYIKPFGFLRPGDRVVIAARESCRGDDDRRSAEQRLSDQIANLKRIAELHGLIVVAVVKHIGSGSDPTWLYRAAAAARREGAAILAETTNRLIRHPDYHSKKNFRAQASELELWLLQLCTNGVSLVTHCPPDASPGEERSYATERGQAATGKRGGGYRGPGYKKRLREQHEPEARRLHETEGLSLREVARRIGRPLTTVADWRKKWGS